MKGDFTRNSFDPTRHFSRVLLQQGRVNLDADVNEQSAILLRFMRTLTADLLGQSEILFDENLNTFNTGSGPLNHLGLKITATGGVGDFSIGAGRYYVSGVLCENEKDLLYTQQPNYPLPTGKLLKDATGFYVVYLDVWERHITYIEDEHTREVALGGPDTSTRAQVLWQVKVFPFKFDGKDAAGTKPANKDKIQPFTSAKAVNAKAFDDFFKGSDFILASRAGLRARAKQEDAATDPCAIPPENKYRGLENQLYRVEIHEGTGIDGKATFKWSRENGSVTFPILEISQDTGAKTTLVSLASLGRDQKLGLAVGDWIELVDDVSALQNLAEPLLQVIAINPQDMTVTLNALPAAADRCSNAANHPLLRRWDQRPKGKANEVGRGIPVVEGDPKNESDWITLEDGVQILFEKPNANAKLGNIYRSGDYWLIPARTLTGDVEWPQEDHQPKALPPQGVPHYYAGLAGINVNKGVITVSTDSRMSFDALTKPTNV
jgi:Family of unknown function (DUF6519)